MIKMTKNPIYTNSRWQIASPSNKITVAVRITEMKWIAASSARNRRGEARSSINMFTSQAITKEIGTLLVSYMRVQY